MNLDQITGQIGPILRPGVIELAAVSIALSQAK